MNLAYVAGIIDGEGCIGFAKNKDVYIPRLLVVNTHVPLLEYLKEAFGGDIHPLSRAKENWKPAYQWRLSNSKCAELLDAVYPHLLVKRCQADLVFAWDAIRPGNSGNRWNEESMAALQLIVDQSHWLNERGNTSQSRAEPMQLALVA